MVETLNSWKFEWNQSSKHESAPYKPYKPTEYREDTDAENILTQLEESNENEPKRIQVRNRPCVVWEKAWIYEGTRISWGENNYDNPCGKWRFVWNDWNCIFEWNWNDDGVFMDGNVVANWKTYNITKVDVHAKDKTRISRLHWTGNVEWLKYNCILDEHLELSSITYAWVTLKLVHERWKIYLENKDWKRLALPYFRVIKAPHSSRDEKNPEEDFVAVKIAECISIVKNSWKELNKFEVDFRTARIQADYKNTFSDVDLMDNPWRRLWIHGDDLVDWLNASRKDFWI